MPLAYYRCITGSGTLIARSLRCCFGGVGTKENWCGLILCLSVSVFGCHGSSTSNNRQSSDAKTAGPAPGATAAEAQKPGSYSTEAAPKPAKLPVDPALIYVTRANALYQEGKYDEALAALNKARDLKENSSLIHALIGVIHDDRGETEEARTELDIALDLMPPHEVVAILHEKLLKLRLTLGRRAEARGDTGRAQREYEKAAKYSLAPKRLLAMAHAAYALLLERQGRTGAALKEYRVATILDPSNVTLRGAFADLLMDTGARDEAIRQYRVAIMAVPNSADLRVNLCVALLAVRKRSEAIQVCLEALRINPDSFEAHMSLGATYGRDGQLTKATEQFREALRLKPDSEEARANLEEAQQMQRQQ